jgi:hypothetical protein
MTGGLAAIADEKPKCADMADLTYDPNAPRKPRPIASSPFWTGDANAAPGFNITPPPDPGFRIPTPMGWLSPEMAGRMMNHLAPPREAIAHGLGVPMDGLAWIAHRMGAKGIPGEKVDADPITNMIGQLPGAPRQQIWQPTADVPLSSQNILRFINQHVPPGGLF